MGQDERDRFPSICLPVTVPAADDVAIFDIGEVEEF
jgi:hypothetical protein